MVSATSVNGNLPARNLPAADLPGTHASGIHTSEPQLSGMDIQGVFFLASMVHCCQDGIIGSDMDGVVRSWNAGAERLFGYSAAETLGRPVRLVIPERLEQQAALAAQIAAGGAGWHIDIKALHRSGREMAVAMTVSPIKDASGAVIGVSRVAREMSGDRAEARLKALVDGSVDGIITIDERGTLESFNRACERFFGYTEEEVVGQNLKLLMPPHYHEAHDTSFFRYLRTGEARVIGSSGVELTARRKDGSDFPIDLSVSVFTIDGRPHFAGIVRDITKRKQAEAEAARDTRALIRSNQSLDEFAYAASHDLRAPLRVIDNASKWLEEDLREHLTGENLENMQLLRRRIKRLEKLLDDMLEYSRIGRNADENYKTILSGDALMADVLSMVTVPATFEVIVSPAFAAIRVCRMPLQQVLMNLIGNAIKHHDKMAGRIELEVQTGASMYTFTVRDDGPGIPEQFRERIFKMLETLQPKDRVEGSGMGLAMVRKHVELFEGTVTAEAAPGRGSVFRFTWPIRQPQVG